MRVLVCGGRDFKDIKLLNDSLSKFRRERGLDVVIEGDAPGADRMAGYWARKNRIHNEKFAADWDDLVTPPVVIRKRPDGSKYNAAAGPVRNEKMLVSGRPDVVIAFRGGTGTADMIKRARGVGIEVIEIA